MAEVKLNRNFFVEGTGKAVVGGKNGKVGYIHLQNATFEFSSKMENIEGGESNASLFSYQTEKDGKVTFQNASMDAQTVALTQGVTASKKAVVFAMEEKVKVDTDGTATLAHAATADLETLVLSTDEGEYVPYKDGKVDAKYANQTLVATYAYSVNQNAVGVDVKTTSVPGYVTIFFRSKPVKQKDGRILRQFLTIYKARSDGSLKVDFKHKNAFAPELTFNIVDPERTDEKFWAYSWQDVTEEEAGNPDVVVPTESAGE
ncbi:hypothetical protein SELR_pSRC400340 (plasmid) [Selenomonas ruminantium subsp. lactilytica TAM6421]|uniref:Uncharacterized protein n=1 Tax=Selenomonas ruminantium subsp. lactilytica (strain NBRC 103574 / TAM6421) TaxID=927704 RepID=I0GV98_SELRL|nr:hypothetical protein [Selenomonas ruminantium]BAL84685.1 hypothetical protein SELR_pSRC400340 [Selenomonas ruminantium subsp. lactilytica TAM6421]